MSENNMAIPWVTFLVVALVITAIAQSVAIIGMYQKINERSVFREGGAPDAGMVVAGATNGHAFLPSEFFDRDVFGVNPENWDPFKEMQSMHDRINQMFGNAFNRFGLSDDFSARAEANPFVPSVDIQDKGGLYVVTVDLPGNEASHLDVKVEDRMLTISGFVKTEINKEDKDSMLRQERRTGAFYRTVTLPGPVKADEITTREEKGVLYIEIPKDTGNKP